MNKIPTITTNRRNMIMGGLTLLAGVGCLSVLGVQGLHRHEQATAASALYRTEPVPAFFNSAPALRVEAA